MNRRCLEFCSPERRDNPYLYHRNAEGNLEFNFNSSIQESGNAYITGTTCLGMPREASYVMPLGVRELHNERGRCPPTRFMCFHALVVFAFLRPMVYVR